MINIDTRLDGGQASEPGGKAAAYIQHINAIKGEADMDHLCGGL